MLGKSQIVVTLTLTRIQPSLLLANFPIHECPCVFFSMHQWRRNEVSDFCNITVGNANKRRRKSKMAPRPSDRSKLNLRDKGCDIVFITIVEYSNDYCDDGSRLGKLLARKACFQKKETLYTPPGLDISFYYPQVSLYSMPIAPILQVTTCWCYGFQFRFPCQIKQFKKKSKKMVPRLYDRTEEKSTWKVMKNCS